MISYKKHWLELIFAGENPFPKTKNCISFQKYAVCKRVVSIGLYVSYCSEFSLNMQKKKKKKKKTSGGLKKFNF